MTLIVSNTSILSIVGLSTMFILWTVITNISTKITMDRFQERYSFYAAQFMNILYVPFGFILLAYLGKKVPENAKKFPQWIYFYIAIFDSFGVLLNAIANENTPGELQTLLSQFTIPFSMLGSYFYLKKRYGYMAYIGAIVILGGISISAFTATSSSGSKFNPISCIIYASSFVFFAFSFVAKEWCFNHSPNARLGPKFTKLFRLSEDMEIPNASPYHLTTWVALWMVPITFAIYFIQCIPGFGSVDVSDLIPNLIGGAKCMVGISSYPDDTCYGTWMPLWMWLMVFSIGTFVSGVLAVMLTQKASALVQFISNSVTIPLSSLTYAFAPLMYPFTESVSLWNIASICVILIGLTIYTFGDKDIYRKIKRNKNDELENPFIPVPGAGAVINTRDNYYIS